MAPEQQRIAIAEWCGVSPSFRWSGGQYFKDYPDYLNDLNAMHEAEEKLKGLDWAKYFQWIQTNGKATGVRATSSERAEGVLRTIGKWKD